MTFLHKHKLYQRTFAIVFTILLFQTHSLQKLKAQNLSNESGTTSASQKEDEKPISDFFQKTTGLSFDDLLKQSAVKANAKGEGDTALILISALIILAFFQSAVIPISLLLIIFLGLRYIPVIIRDKQNQKIAIVQNLLPLIADDKIKSEIIKSFLKNEKILNTDVVENTNSGEKKPIEVVSNKQQPLAVEPANSAKSGKSDEEGKAVDLTHE